MLLLVPGTLHQVHKQECIHYGKFRNNRFSEVMLLVWHRSSLPPSSVTDSNIRKELLHLVQGRLLPPDEECYSVNHRLDLKRNLFFPKQNLCVTSHGSVVSLALSCRVAVLDKVTDFLLFLGKLLISGSVGGFLPANTICNLNVKKTGRYMGLSMKPITRRTASG